MSSQTENDPLALTARKAIHDTDFVGEANCCQMFVRECLDATYGDKKYAGFRADSAKHAAAKWKAAGLAVPPDQLDDYPLPGDILYKTTTAGTFGHVGIACGRLHLAGGDNEVYVAENATTKTGRQEGCKGYRTLRQFGKVDLVVRLAPPGTTAGT